MKKHNKSGFTLLEIIIVIIIIGVLASLALPRLFSTVEFSRSAEALATMATIRGSLERCYLQSNGDYTNCRTATSTLGNLDIDDPATAPNAHFTYTITSASPAGYVLVATRNATEGGVATSTITLTQTAAGITKVGAGAFKSIK